VNKMLKRVISITGLILVSLTLNNCFALTLGVPSGTTYFNSGKTDFSANGYDIADVEGEACATSLFMVIAFGDASINTAADSMGIKNIRSVSHKFNPNWFGYHSVCTIVRGTR
jgi:hypothetical protein